MEYHLKLHMYYLLFFTLLQQFGSLMFFVSQAEKCVEQIRKDKETNWSISSMLDSEPNMKMKEIENEEIRDIYSYTILQTKMFLL